MDHGTPLKAEPGANLHLEGFGSSKDDSCRKRRWEVTTNTLDNLVKNLKGS